MGLPWSFTMSIPDQSPPPDIRACHQNTRLSDPENVTKSKWKVTPTLLRRASGSVRGQSRFVWTAEAEYGVGEPCDADRGAGWHAARPPAAPPPLLWLHLQAVAAQVFLGGQARTLRTCLPTLLRHHHPSSQCTPGVFPLPQTSCSHVSAGTVSIQLF